MVYQAFFRAQIDASQERGTPWPDAPEAEGAVIVGRIGASFNYLWHTLTQDAAAADAVAALPGFMGTTYDSIKGHGNGQDILLAEIEEDDPENPGQMRRRRVKMRDKPNSGVVQENLPPHFYGGNTA